MLRAGDVSSSSWGIRGWNSGGLQGRTWTELALLCLAGCSRTEVRGLAGLHWTRGIPCCWGQPPQVRL